MKAIAVQDAIDRATGDVLVVADADVWCEGLQEALDRSPGHPVTIPHGKVLRLSERGSVAFRDGERHPDIAEEHRGMPGGGIVILRRDVWERVPLDPRFVGWGGEDRSWATALEAVTG